MYFSDSIYNNASFCNKYLLNKTVFVCIKYWKYLKTCINNTKSNLDTFLSVGCVCFVYCETWNVSDSSSHHFILGQLFN